MWIISALQMYSLSSVICWNVPRHPCLRTIEGWLALLRMTCRGCLISWTTSTSSEPLTRWQGIVAVYHNIWKPWQTTKHLKHFNGQIHLHRSLSAYVPTYQYLLTFRYQSSIMATKPLVFPFFLFFATKNLILPETRQASHQWLGRTTTMSTCSMASATSMNSFTFLRSNSLYLPVKW